MPITHFFKKCDGEPKGQESTKMVRKRKEKIEKLSDKMSEREASGSHSRHFGTLLPFWFSIASLGINVQRASHS